MRPLPALLLLALPAFGAPDGGREAEADIFRRWDDAGPDERRRMLAVLEHVDRARRFSDARPVLVEIDGARLSLAEVFTTILEPALETPTAPETEGDLGLTDLHRRALAALAAVRAAYAPPRPARTGTLNLFLDYAYGTLAAPALPAAARLRFFTEALRNVRALDGRAAPDARTRWIVRTRLLPALLGLARSVERNEAARATVGEAASLLYMPSILDADAQAALAPLTTGTHAREILLRSYRLGLLDDAGVVALARSVALQARDDPAFAAGAAPLLLELFGDDRVPGRERGALVDVVLDRLAPLAPLQDTVANLLAAAFGGPPRAIGEYAREHGAAVPAPNGDRAVRFLEVVLLQDDPERPPAVARVVRADVALFEPIRARDADGQRRFVGMLVPAAAGDHADFLGPPPGLGAARDSRLLRRTLRLERVALRAYGARGEEIELCVALPEDASDPVPVRGATLADVVALVRRRLEGTAEADERRDLVRLLVRLGTQAARALAVAHADTPGAAAEIVTLAEAGDRDAAAALLDHVAGLDPATLGRACTAALGAGLRDRVRELCGREDVAAAIVAADTLLAHGDAAGVRALFAHGNKYARACAGGLALRLTPLAGSLRLLPAEAPSPEELAALAKRAFDRKRDGAVFDAYGEWLALAFGDAEELRRRRRSHKDLNVDGRPVSPYDFAETWTSRVRGGEGEKLWPQLAYFLLQAEDPGRGIPAEPLEGLLDALEARATGGFLRQVWIDSLVCLACAQSGLEADAHLLELAHVRLARAAGEDAPSGAGRKAGVLWPIWAAREAAP